MSLKNLIRNAVNDGTSKGIRDAVSSAVEKIIAPKTEEYANGKQHRRSSLIGRKAALLPGVVLRRQGIFHRRELYTG